MSKSAALLLVLVFLTASCITIIQPVKASVESVATSASITVQPENVLVGQYIHVLVQIYPPPPTLNDVFQNLTVILVSPLQGISGHGPYQQGPSSTDANGLASFSFLVTDSGTWNVELVFLGQFFANNTIYYQPGNWQIMMKVSSSPTPSPSTIPSTTLTPSPSIPEFPSWIFPLPLSITVVAAGLLVYFKKRKH